MTTTPQPPLLLDQGERVTDAGERILMRTVVDPAAPPRGIAVVAPGFGRGMLEVTPIAVYLARNGLAVLRYEWMTDAGERRPREDTAFTLSKGLARLTTALGAAIEAYPELPTAVVGASVSGRLAYRLAARGARPDAVVTLLGVVNMRDTLRRVLTVDYHDWPRSELPATAVIEGVLVDVPLFWEDGHTHGWRSLDSTATELAEAPGFIANFLSAEDAWVDPDDAVAAFRGPQGGPRRVCEIGAGHHDVGRNPVALQATLARLTEVVLEGLDLPLPDGMAVPTFHDIIGQRIAERRATRRTRVG
jgi:hypothetical protein